MSEKILHLEEMSWKQIDELERDSTIFFYPISPLEEHGPHLPVGTDFFTARDTAEEAIKQLQEKKEVRGVLLPATPIGYSKINADFPGTFTVSPRVVREVVYSVIASLGSQGFKYLVICTFHMALGHLKGIYQAMEKGRRRYNMRICEPWGPYFYSDRILGREPKLGFDTSKEVHGGFRETSLMKYQYPYLVDESYRSLQSIYRDLSSPRVYGKTFRELGLKDGYIGSPSRADTDYGRWYFNEIVSIIVEETCNLYDGKPTCDLPRSIKRLMKLVF
ncbi:MAG TPA: creatininase family protein [Thermoplasmatales archaeon]|nr:creatininase family protein [Thermoplasmatales archaeon]